MRAPEALVLKKGVDMKKRVAPFAAAAVVLVMLITACQPAVEPLDEGGDPSPGAGAHSAADARVVVLMYHRIGDSPLEYQRTAADFRSDMEFLADEDFEVIDFDDLFAIRTGAAPAPGRKLAIITFDDGWSSDYSHAFPVLSEFGYKATFFVITSIIGHSDRVTWNQLRQMADYRSGGTRLFAIGSHTVTHPALAGSASFKPRSEYLAFLQYELGKSRDSIASRIVQRALVLSLPYGNGAGNRDIEKTALKLGYKGIRTSDTGYPTKSGWENSPVVPVAALDPYRMPSFPVYGDTDMAGLSALFLP